MSSCFKYLDFPALSDAMHTEIYNSFLENPNYFEFKEDKFYKIHLANDKLTETVKSIIPNPGKISVQLIQNSLPIHVDIGRTEAINYLISTGGDDVYTCFYQNNMLVDRLVIQPFRWHWMKVSNPHTVINLKKDQPRISITISY
jgi:hypothetical protein